MKRNIAAEVEELRELVRQGAVGKAKDRVRGLGQRRLPREQLESVAIFARQLWLPEISLRLLRPVVRPASRRTADATEGERVEYGAALADIKADREALEIFAGLDAAREPKMLLFQSWIHFRHWNWADTIPVLERYCASPRLSPALALGGQVNLAAACLHGEERRDTARAVRLLEAVLAATGRGENRFHRNHALLGLAQAAYFERRWADGRKLLEEMERTTLDRDDIYNGLRVRQWRGLLELGNAAARKLDASPRLAELRAIGRDAGAAACHEVARSCDYYAALFTGERGELEHLYFGTPFPRFKARILRALGEGAAFPRTHEWRPRGPESGARFALDVRTGENSRGPALLKPGQALQRLLRTLSSDFYAPMRLGALHEGIFPGEYYNPNSSPDRVHQCLKRLRHWLESHAFPLAVAETDGLYSLQSLGNCRLTVPDHDAAPAEVLDARIGRLLAGTARRFGTAPFSAAQAAKHLEISHRSANDYLRLAEGHRLVEKTGRGPATRFRFRTPV